MTPPILGQRSHGELITELYDHHAAGLFAYCHDQLGDLATAAAALVAVFAGVPAAEPPRAALYALARREIQRRDVRYAPPAPGPDPVSVFVGRVLRDLRPHQREVLYLSGVCEMNTSELSWVLDVAADTADELTVSACRRFAQSLELALASVRVPGHLTDAFGALGIAPIRDVLVRAPWAVPPPALRVTVLGPQPGTAAAPRPLSTQPPASTSLTPLRPLWPTAPVWPLPLAETDALTSTSVFSPPDLPPPFSPADFFPVPATQDRFPDPFSPPDPDVVSAHEATTEPIPKLKDSVLSALDELVPRSPRRRLQRPKPRRAMPLSAPSAADVLDASPAQAVPGDASPARDLFEPFTPEPRAARPHTDKLVAAAPKDGLSDTEATLPGWPLRADELDTAAPGQQESLAARPTLPGWPLRADELDTPLPGDRARHAKRPGAGQPEEAKRTAGTGRAARAERPGLHRAAHRARAADDIRPEDAGPEVNGPELKGPQIAGPRVAGPENTGVDIMEPESGGSERTRREDTGREGAEPADFESSSFREVVSPPETNGHGDSVTGEAETTRITERIRLAEALKAANEIQAAKVQAAESRTAENQGSGAQAPEVVEATEVTEAAETKTAGTVQATENQAVQNQIAQNQAVQNQAVQNRAVESPAAENQAAATAQAAETVRSARASGRTRRKHRPAGNGEQRHDWAWELFGFVICVICVAIAMLVFFAVPPLVTP